VADKTERWSAEKYRAHVGIKEWPADESPYQPDKPPPKPTAAPYRSKLEAKYASHLEMLRIAGKIQEWRYEPIRLRLAKLTTYTPDFLLLGDTGDLWSQSFTDVGSFSTHMVFVEVKGSWKAKGAAVSRNKLKIAAEMYPWFHFTAATYRNGTWEHEAIW
jgi:hypothetical protein